MTSLQLGLIVAGIALVVGVVIYNWLAERKVRRRIRDAFSESGSPQETATRSVDARVEPSLPIGRGSGSVPENAPRELSEPSSATDDYEAPIAVHARLPSDAEADEVDENASLDAPTALSATPLPAKASSNLPQPDPDIECVVTLQPARPVTAGALASGLHARLGRPLRWFGRQGGGLPWQLLKSDTVGDFTEIAACMLLANRSGAASVPLLEAFYRVVGEVAKLLPAAIKAPDATVEAARAEALDRICADLDMQIGITVLKLDATQIAGTRLRGIAEAAGFRLADGGRFDWIHEETGTVLYSLQNYRPEPFTAEMLRQTSTPGAVFLLDVPRVVEPVKAYDQMRLAAKRLAQTLEATLVDDNRRPIDDAALTSIRDQVRVNVAAMREVNIEPGSPRALALFGG